MDLHRRSMPLSLMLKMIKKIHNSPFHNIEPLYSSSEFHSPSIQEVQKADLETKYRIFYSFVSLPAAFHSFFICHAREAVKGIISDTNNLISRLIIQTGLMHSNPNELVYFFHEAVEVKDKEDPRLDDMEIKTLSTKHLIAIVEDLEKFKSQLEGHKYTYEILLNFMDSFLAYNCLGKEDHTYWTNEYEKNLFKLDKTKRSLLENLLHPIELDKLQRKKKEENVSANDIKKSSIQEINELIQILKDLIPKKQQKVEITSQLNS